MQRILHGSSSSLLKFVDEINLVCEMRNWGGHAASKQEPNHGATSIHLNNFAFLETPLTLFQFRKGIGPQCIEDKLTDILSIRFGICIYCHQGYWRFFSFQLLFLKHPPVSTLCRWRYASIDRHNSGQQAYMASSGWTNSVLAGIHVRVNPGCRIALDLHRRVHRLLELISPCHVLFFSQEFPCDWQYSPARNASHLPGLNCIITGTATGFYIARRLIKTNAICFTE